jgi:hypothetical protein
MEHQYAKGGRMKPINRPFQYRNAEETRKPGYLARRFSEIRKKLREQSAKPSNLAQIPRRSAK